MLGMTVDACSLVPRPSSPGPAPRKGRPGDEARCVCAGETLSANRLNGRFQSLYTIYGGSFGGSIGILLDATISMNLEPFKESLHLPPYMERNTCWMPALPICSAVAVGRSLSNSDIYCFSSSESFNFFSRLVFPCPNVADTVSQPLQA